MRLLVTGGSGFIGNHLLAHIVDRTNHEILNIDCLTYSGNPHPKQEIQQSPRYSFAQIDLCNAPSLQAAIDRYQPEAAIHLAAESHVDRSIKNPKAFIDSNIYGTFNLLEAIRAYLSNKETTYKSAFRLLHISTDEVYGTLKEHGSFTERSPYRPNSPYSASKAASDHLMRAWNQTYDIPLLQANCSNTFGPLQYPEKLIPLVINRAINKREIPIYGNGQNIRDWLYVEDLAKALTEILEKGTIGECYNVGGNNEIRNIDLVRTICKELDQIQPRADGISYAEQIRFVPDRLGHDFRYSIDVSKIHKELGWAAQFGYAEAIRKTILWNLENREWVENRATS